MYNYFYGAEADQFSFYRIPKILFTEERFQCISAEAKVLYGLLLDRMSLSARNGWLDAEGRVYIIFSVEDIMTAMGCANQKAGKLLYELESKSYSSWEYYNTTRHKRTGTCTSCGETTYDYGNHSKKNTAVPYNSTQHKYGSYCAACQSFIGSVSYQNQPSPTEAGRTTTELSTADCAPVPPADTVITNTRITLCHTAHGLPQTGISISEPFPAHADTPLRNTQTIR